MSESSLMRLASAIRKWQEGGHSIAEIRLNPNMFAPNLKNICGIPVAYGTDGEANWEIQLADIDLSGPAHDAKS